MELATSADITTMDYVKIQAQVLLPLARALREEIGEERTRELLQAAIEEVSRARIRDQAEQLGGSPLERFRSMMSRSASVNGPQLEMEFREVGPESMQFDVKRCKYAELFQALGETEIGTMLLCDGDAYVAEIGGAAVEFQRSQTIMEGGSHCDFCYRINRME
ncbi:MAG: L-2-amino-thiazoline-4-carboxylic acid hydrolase [bacterium]|nr:L-2-amino-thiazoline-4-carboxylic acid hydrolase [bacterium]